MAGMAIMTVPQYIALKGKVREYVSERGEVSFLQMSRVFHLTYNELETLFEDFDGANVNIGIQIQGVGHAELDRGEWTVEML